MNHLPQHYSSERLVAAVTAFDWSTDAASSAIKIIQATVHEWFGEVLTSGDAGWILGSLLDRRLIRSETYPDGRGAGGPKDTFRRRSRYVKLAPDEDLIIKTHDHVPNFET